ncbi:MAG: sigma factor [Ktedonobacteraceae bacterium]
MREPHKDALRTDSSRITKTALSHDLVFHSDVGSYDDDPPLEPEALLAFYTFDYIHEKVKCLVSLLVKFTHPDVLDLELGDIAAEVHAHFWQKLQEKEQEPIQKPEAYLSRMIRNRYYDEIRKRKRPSSPRFLSMLADGTVQDEKALIKLSSGMADPAFECEQKQNIAHLYHKIAYAVSKLPARQKLAMTCELLEKVDNLAWMTDALMIYGVDTEVQWPQGEKAKQRLQASLPPARKAIARRLNVDISVFIGIKQRSRK